MSVTAPPINTFSRHTTICIQSIKIATSVICFTTKKDDRHFRFGLSIYSLLCFLNDVFYIQFVMFCRECFFLVFFNLYRFSLSLRVLMIIADVNDVVANNDIDEYAVIDGARVATW